MQIDIGVVGVGGLGSLQTKVFAEMADARVVGAADVSEDARATFEAEFGVPAYEDYQSLLETHGPGLDAVAIVTPHTLHYEQAMAAMERDLHVLVEKPMVTDVADAVALVETARERDLVFQVGYQRHFHPAFREIRRLIESGHIGSVHSVNCYLGQDWIEPHRGTWRTNPDLAGGGQLYDSGSHILDALLWTTDGEPRSVASQIEFSEPGIDVNSSLSVRLETGDDVVLASVHVSGDGADVEPKEGYVYWGTEGRITYTDGRIAVTEKGATTDETDVGNEVDFQTLNERKMANFLESVAGTADPAVPGSVGLQVTALTEAAYRSESEGCVVRVQPLIEQARSSRAGTGRAGSGGR